MYLIVLDFLQLMKVNHKEPVTHKEILLLGQLLFSRVLNDLQHFSDINHDIKPDMKYIECLHTVCTEYY